jgi:hypothetical protein
MRGHARKVALRDRVFEHGDQLFQDAVFIAQIGGKGGGLRKAFQVTNISTQS